MDFQFGRQSGLRSAGSAIDQLAAQLRVKRIEHVVAMQEELAALREELLEARRALARLLAVFSTFEREPGTWLH